MSDKGTSDQARLHFETLHEQLIDTISSAKPRDCVWVTINPGTGKSYALTTAVRLFLQRNPSATAAYVADTLQIAQLQYLLSSADFPIVPLRDDREMRNWLYHSPGFQRGLLLVASRAQRWLPKLAVEHALNMLVIDASTWRRNDPHFDFADSAERLVIVNPGSLAGQISRGLKENFNSIHATSKAIASAERETETRAAIRKVIIPYGISDAERALIDDGTEFFSRKDAFDRRQQIATASSRASFGAALLAAQYREVAPGVHTLLERSSSQLAFEFSDVESMSPGHSFTPAQEQLPPAWGVSQPDLRDAIDALLDRLDDLGDDGKLIALRGFISSSVTTDSGVAVLVQNSATAEYVRQYLASALPDISVDVLKKRNSSILKSQPAPAVIVISDTDLGYVAKIPRNFRQLWFDSPFSESHGNRRIELAEHRVKVIAALVASPPLQCERSELIKWGFAPVNP